ncbi:phospholipase D-like domain-containing protein [Massilia putida]|uniref:phospholipase D-like domain-containing protein n=1 Tax=Massilia putida TaxID=1141883 RepID=UPI0009F8BFC2|nr:phospholipase D-like domain-containing protein [Massilia putida]
MLLARIGLVSQSASVDFPELSKVAAAINLQVARDLAPIWGVTGAVSALANAEAIEPGVWPVYVCDTLDDDLAGFHLTAHNQPYAMVQYGPTWSLGASHEVMEMLLDPSGNRLIAANAVGIVDNEICDVPGKVEYLLEICDPSEDDKNAYLIDGVLVSDFYTPDYFAPSGTIGGRYSFSGRVERPRQVLPNGYLTWFDPITNLLQQVRHFGAPAVRTLATGRPGEQSLTGGLSLRTFVDGLTRPIRPLTRALDHSAVVRVRDERERLVKAAGVSRATLFLAAANNAKKYLAANVHSAMSSHEQAAAALAAHVKEVSLPGVLSARPSLRWAQQAGAGYEILLTVQPNQLADLETKIPRELDEVPVRLRAASAMQRIRAERPVEFVTLAGARHELREPQFDDEIFFDENGTRIDPPLATAFAARPGKEQIPYSQPDDATLDEVMDDVSLVLHASPDAGWDQLSGFLEAVEEELVVGMYDFTSAHVLQAVERALAGAGKRLMLTLDHPAPNPSRDQDDDATFAELAEKLDVRFAGAWALTRTDPKAPIWIYPNAYHIKVAVRDRHTFWLSSGNWNNSNQPEIDLSDLAAARKIAAGHDRDWHVIVTSQRLANTFHAFLAHDYALAHDAEAKAAAMGIAAMPATPMPEVPVEAFAAGRAPRTFFTPKTLSGTMRIQPLLTPDNYSAKVLPLIQSATQKFYMQTQYIHPSGKPGDEEHDRLITAVRDLVERGLDVRLITSEFQTDDWVEKLVTAGIPASVLRRQPKVHNKGILIDGEVVMVSSQNWSADGTQRNRDAGLIIYNAEANAYFEQIFLHDWDNLASPAA